MKDKLIRHILGAVLVITAYPAAVYTGDGIFLFAGLFGLLAMFIGD